MKQDFKDPMDSLLREHARRVAARASSVRADAAPQRMTIDGNNMEHLDADEMAAFAENALPAAARARYVAHLADCDGCRQLLVALTHAEHIAPEAAKSIPPQSIAQSLSWREKFAALFALPAALRYVVPALAAVLFVALMASLLVNRREREATLVASKQETQTTAARTDSASSDTENSISGNANSTASSDSGSSDSASMSNTATTTATTTTTKRTATTANVADPARGATNANSSLNRKEASATSTSQNNHNSSGNLPLVANRTTMPVPNERQDFDKDASRATNPKRAVASQPSTANANMSGNSAGIAATQNEQIRIASDRAAKPREEKASSNNDDVAAPTSDSPPFSAEVRAAARRRAPSATTAAKSAVPASGRAARSSDASAALSPSRRINGHDFRRQGTRWIDAVYTASQSTTNIARGSKQFRTVVNAEPGIGKIAAQLDGEVIVVWKGRAYRIH